MKKDLSLLQNITFKLPTFVDCRGALTFIQNGKLNLCPDSQEGSEETFSFERAFWIYDVPASSERGGHAHRTCAELLIALHGSFDLELSDGTNTRVIHLDRPDKGVLIRPMVWCRLFNFSSDFVGLCLASQEYLPEGYINSFEDFVSEN